MIESFFYGAWIGGQAVYWFFFRHQTAVLGEEYWQMLKNAAYADARVMISVSVANCSQQS
jgi:hypothetical protein